MFMASNFINVHSGRHTFYWIHLTFTLNGVFLILFLDHSKATSALMAQEKTNEWFCVCVELQLLQDVIKGTCWTDQIQILLQICSMMKQREGRSKQKMSSFLCAVMALSCHCHVLQDYEWLMNCGGEENPGCWFTQPPGFPVPTIL